MSSELVPLFMPSLAAMLAAAEQEKGAPLTEQEVIALRDGAVVMMVTPDGADSMAVSRGYRDVDPEDCWADWHRLRVEQSGKGYLPKIVLCVVGDAAFGGIAAELLTAESVECEVTEHDERMTKAFRASACRVAPSFTDEEFSVIERHDSVVYALGCNFGAGAALAEARRMLELGARLLQSGGVAMKCESAGIAHGRARWLALAKDESNEALFHAFVRYPIGGEEDFYSCGLHLLGRPDLIVSRVAVEENPMVAVNLFQTFALYLLTECPPNRFASGHTFRCDQGSPDYVVRWEPCHGYAEDDFFFNPFGRYRFQLE
jgi:hypothetical protein